MTAALRVMHVVLSLAPGGAERLVVDLSRRQARSLGVSVCCLDEEGRWAGEVRDAGIPVTVLGRQPGFHPSLGMRLAAQAAAQRVDVLHCHQYTPFVYGAIAGWRRPRMSVVFTEHGRHANAQPSPKRRLANLALARRANAVVAVSDELRSFMAEEGFVADRVRVIRNGIETGAPPEASDATRARVALALPHDAIVVGTVARFDPVKGLDLLLQAFAELRKTAPNAVLVMAGDGPERAALEQLGTSLGIAQAVRWIGLRQDARELLPAFDVFCNTSTSEGISLTLLEAMAASRAVVATAVGGTPEVVRDFVSGRLVARSVGGVAEAMVDLARDPALRAALGRVARSVVCAKFSAERMASDYLEIYRDTRQAA